MFLAIQPVLLKSVVPNKKAVMLDLFVVSVHGARYSEKFVISRVSFYRAKFILSQISLYREIPSISRVLSLCHKIFYIKI